MYTIQVSEFAENDLVESYSYYEEINPALADAFFLEADNMINSIAENPFLHQKFSHGYRIAFLKRFPFGIHFEVEKEQVFISAIFHTSRNPENYP